MARGRLGPPARAPDRTPLSSSAIFIEASDGTTSPVWVFKPDGVPRSVIEAFGSKHRTPLSTRNGSFLLLDSGRVAVSEHGFSTLTIYEIDTRACARQQIRTERPHAAPPGDRAMRSSLAERPSRPAASDVGGAEPAPPGSPPLSGR